MDDLDFLNTFVHDLKIPIGAIRGFLDMIEQTGSLNEHQQKYLHRAHEKVDRALEMVKDMLQVVRFESNTALNLKWLNLVDILTGMLDALDSQIAQKHIVVHLEIDPSAREILADENWINHALLNLLSNAIKYNRESGEVVVKAMQHGAMIRIDIHDTGLGIAPHELPHMFERFYRAKSARDSRIEGSGLGLSIVKMIVERHGGEVGVESVVNTGSVFSVWLPHHDKQTTDLASLSIKPTTQSHRHDMVNEAIDAFDDDSQELPEDRDTDSHDDQR